MQNIYPPSLFYLTGHCYVRSMFAKHHFFKTLFVVVAVVVCLFVVAVFLFYYYYFFNFYKLDCNFFIELCKFFPISNKVLIMIK